MAKVFDFKNDYIGLSEEKAAENTDLYGYNSDTRLDETDKGYRPVSAFFNLRFVLMAACALLSFIYGLGADNGFEPVTTGVVLIVLCGMYAATEIVKNKYTDEYFFELKHRAKVNFRVIRDGEVRNVRRELLVPDDILILSEGERVPADAHLLEIHDLTVDEGIFTGDKTPVMKIVGTDSVNEEIKRSCIYKGTKIVSGELAARVTATGVDTIYYKTFGAPKETDEYYTSFEKAVIRVANIFIAAAAVMLVFGCLFHFTKINIRADNPALNTIYNTLYPAAAFAMCFIPSEIASFIRLYYVRGAKLIEENNASIKSLGTIEHINAVTCILIDKSGMVTKKHVDVADVLTANEEMLTNISVLACSRTPGDPFDQAIIMRATFGGTDISALTENECIKEYPFDENEGAAGNVWLVGGKRLLCIKGAPDKLLPLCDVPNDMLYTVQNKQISFGQQGYNVLAAAFAQLDDDAELPENISSAHYSFMGLIAFANQTKDYIPVAIRKCHRAGIRVIMMTGDSPETSFSVAKKVGIKGETVATGSMLTNNEDFDISDTGVFARITAEQKPLIIKKLREAGEIVAITGEGASDSNLLEIADVGIALSGNASGAAFEACDIITGDDSFERVTDILRTARQTHLNVKRCMSVALTSLIVLVIFAVFNLLMNTSFLITPVICSLITVAVVPALLMMFYKNNEDMRDTMESSEYIGTGRLRRSFFILPAVQGLGLAMSEIIYYLLASGIGRGEEIMSEMTENMMGGFFLIYVIGLILACITDLVGKNITSLFKADRSFALKTAGIVLAASAAAVFIPFINTVFGFGNTDIRLFLIALVITIVFQIPAFIICLNKDKRSTINDQ